MGKKNGYAFILVICIATLMSALLMGILTLSLSARKTTKGLEDTYRLSSMSESGIEKGLACVRQKIQTNTAIFSNKKTSLACDSFSFTDSGITCTVDITDYTDTSVTPNIPEVKIDSTAKNAVGKQKENIVYINKNEISNVYYQMLFSNVITVLGNKNESDSNYKTAFDMGDDINDIALDGNMYLQGNDIKFQPISKPVDDSNDYPNMYYDYTDSDGILHTYQPYPYHDTVARTYISGQVNINCNTLSIPQDSRAGVPSEDGPGTQKIFNKKVTLANTLTPLKPYDQARVGKCGPSEYSLLDVVENKADTDLTLFPDYSQPHYNIYFVKPLPGANLATFLIVRSDTVTGVVFDYDSFIQKVKSYLENNLDVFNGISDYDQKEAIYSNIYKLFLIQGDVNIKTHMDYEYDYYGNLLSYRKQYVNNIIYSTGKVNICTNYDYFTDYYGYSHSYAQNISLNNCGILGRSVTINKMKDNPLVTDDYDNNYILLPFERAVSLHGVKKIGAASGVYHLSPYSQDNRDSCNLFLLKHISGYADYFTFKIDKWVEK